jgi:uncharacterized protein
MMDRSTSALRWVQLRFYAELIDLAGRRETWVPVGSPRSVKDAIEACGVPHPEVELVLVDGRAVGFDHQVSGTERVAVYPPFHALDLGELTTVRPPPIAPRFVLDVHLGALTRRLRLLGFDCWYRTDAHDRQLAAVAVDEQRILLTRDRGLLMRKVITHGYGPRSHDPELQALEVIRRYELSGRLAPFTRCVPCNGRLERVPRDQVADLVPPRSFQAFDQFARCIHCGQVFWPGSHLDATAGFVGLAAAIGHGPSHRRHARGLEAASSPERAATSNNDAS